MTLAQPFLSRGLYERVILKLKRIITGPGNCVNREAKYYVFVILSGCVGLTFVQRVFKYLFSLSR